MNVAIYSQLFGSQHQPLLEVLFGALQRHKARIWLHPLFAPVFNLWQQNMIAVRAEIEIGFRAVADAFNLLTGAVPQS